MSTSAISAYLETQGVLQENVLTRAAAKAVGMAGNVARKVPGFVMKQGTNLAIGIVHALIMNAAFEMFYKVVQPQQEQQAEEYYGPGAPPIREISDAELRAAMVEYLKKMPADQAKALKDKQSDVIREIRKKEKEEKKRLMVQTALKRGSKRGARDESWQESWSAPWDAYSEKLSTELTEARARVTQDAHGNIGDGGGGLSGIGGGSFSDLDPETNPDPARVRKPRKTAAQKAAEEEARKAAQKDAAEDAAKEAPVAMTPETMSIATAKSKYEAEKPKIEAFIKSMDKVSDHKTHALVDDSHSGYAEAKASYGSLHELMKGLVKQRYDTHKANVAKLVASGKSPTEADALANETKEYKSLSKDIKEIKPFVLKMQNAVQKAAEINQHHTDSHASFERVSSTVLDKIKNATGTKKQFEAHENAIKALQKIADDQNSPLQVKQKATLALQGLASKRDELRKELDTIIAAAKPVEPKTSAQTSPSAAVNGGDAGSGGFAGQRKNPTNEEHFGPEITKEANDLIEKFNTAKASKDVAKQLEILDHIEKNKGKFYFDPGPGNGMKRGAFGSVGPSKSLYNARSLYAKEGREGWLSKNKMVNTVNASAAAGSAAAPASKPNEAPNPSTVQPNKKIGTFTKDAYGKPSSYLDPSKAVDGLQMAPSIWGKTGDQSGVVRAPASGFSKGYAVVDPRIAYKEPIGPKLSPRYGSDSKAYSNPIGPTENSAVKAYARQAASLKLTHSMSQPSFGKDQSIKVTPSQNTIVPVNGLVNPNHLPPPPGLVSGVAGGSVSIHSNIAKPGILNSEIASNGAHVNFVSSNVPVVLGKPTTALQKSGLGLGGNEKIALGALSAASLYGIVKAAKAAYNAFTKEDPEAIRNKTDKQLEDMIRANPNAYYDSPTVAAMGLDGKFRMRKIQLTIQEMRKEDAARRASPMARLGDLFRSDVDKQKMYEVHGQNPLNAKGKVVKAAQETGMKVVNWSGKAASDVASKVADHGKRSVITAGQMLVAHATNVVVTHVFVDWLKMDPATVKSHLEKISGSGHNHNISAASVQKAVQEESEKKFVKYYEGLLKDPDPNVQLEGQGLKDLWQKSAPNVKEMIAKDVAAKISQHKASPAFKAWIS